MMTSANDVFVDHHHYPFPGIQIVTPTTDNDHYDDHGEHYCNNWVSDHQHFQLDKHKDQLVVSDDGMNQSMDTKKGIDQANLASKHNNGDRYDPMIESVNINNDNNWVPSSSKLKVVRKINPKRASTEKPSTVVEISKDESPYLPPTENDSGSINSGSHGNSNNIGIRVCFDCNTTKTPLWRSGPKGPKSLCNACGIRQRKVRRALATATATATETTSTSDNNTLTKDTTISTPKSLKLKTSNNNINDNKTITTSSHEDVSNQKWQQPYKKRLKMAGHYHHHHKFTYTSNSQDSNSSSSKNGHDYHHQSGKRNDDKMMCFEEFMTISLSKNDAIDHRVFQQDEKEAAILLMAISCGLFL